MARLNMALNLHFSNESEYKFDQKSLSDILDKTVTEFGVKGEVEINLFVVGEEMMADLHARFMKTREVTDVLSFPLVERIEIDQNLGRDPDGVLRLGDIVICGEVAERQSLENGRAMDEEVAFLAAHGCLHLLGKHHEE